MGFPTPTFLQTRVSTFCPGGQQFPYQQKGTDSTSLLIGPRSFITQTRNYTSVSQLPTLLDYEGTLPHLCLLVEDYPRSTALDNNDMHATIRQITMALTTYCTNTCQTGFFLAH